MPSVANLKTIAPVTVVTAGTRVKIFATSIRTNYIVFTCPSGNTGNVIVGDSNVLFSSSRGIIIAKGTSVVVQVDNLIAPEGLYVDAGTNGDKITATFMELL